MAYSIRDVLYKLTCNCLLNFLLTYWFDVHLNILVLLLTYCSFFHNYCRSDQISQSFTWLKLLLKWSLWRGFLAFDHCELIKLRVVIVVFIIRNVKLFVPQVKNCKDTVTVFITVRPLQCFDAVGWAAGVVECCCGCLSGARCRLAYGPADATATHCHLLQQNPDWFYLSGSGWPG